MAGEKDPEAESSAARAFEDALRSDPEAAEGYALLPAVHQKHYLRWIAGVSTPPAQARRIIQALAMIRTSSAGLRAARRKI